MSLKPPPLPPLLVLTDRKLCAPRPLVDVVKAAVDGGARAVILREKDRPRDERAALADELRPILHDADGLLLVASDPTIESDGVHLAAADPFPYAVATQRRSGFRSAPPVTQNGSQNDGDHTRQLVGRSCHTLDEVRAAEAEGCDYVTLSPIWSSKSKPGYGPTLGSGGLKDVCERTTIPVYGLGGIEEWRAAVTCMLCGAYGAAVMGLAMREPTSERAADLFAKTHGWVLEIGRRP